MRVADSLVNWCIGNRDGEARWVDEGRGPDAEDARAPADKDNGDRTQAKAERGCGVSAGSKARRDLGEEPASECGEVLRRAT
jgi:hypothetical protein